MKRGVVEIQFNWIYVAIVGGLILLIFLNIAIGLKKTAKQNYEYEALRYLDEMLTSLQGNENTETSITLPQITLEFETAKTGSDQCNFFTIYKSERQGQSFYQIPIFSPDILKKRILSFSLGWDIPFRVNYFLYLSSPEIAYVFDGGTEKLEAELPANLTKIRASDFTNQNYYKIKYISTTNPDTSILSSGKDISALKIIPTGGNIYQGGKLIFYKKLNDNWVEEKETYYFDKPTLFAAVYSDNGESYECNLKKALIRANKVSYILLERTENIKQGDLLPFCQKSKYDDAKNSLQSMIDVIESFKFEEQKVLQLKNVVQKLKEINTDLNKKSCPTIY